MGKHSIAIKANSGIIVVIVRTGIEGEFSPMAKTTVQLWPYCRLPSLTQRSDSIKKAKLAVPEQFRCSAGQRAAPRELASDLLKIGRKKKYKDESCKSEWSFLFLVCPPHRVRETVAKVASPSKSRRGKWAIESQTGKWAAK